MSFRNVSVLLAVAFCLLCAIPAGQPDLFALDVNDKDLTAVGGPAKTITLGSLDPNTGFMFLLELTSRGAGIERVTLNKFNNLDHKNLQPLELLVPAVKPNDAKVVSMENKAIVLVESNLQFPLNKLDWNVLNLIKDQNGSEIAQFEATIKDKITGEPFIKLTKTYRITTGIYDLDCDLTVENLSPSKQTIQLDMAGPVGINKEDPRADTRKAVAGFRDIQGQIVSTAFDVKKLKNAKTPEQRQLTQRNAGFLWAAITNKYFAAIVIPMPEPNMNFCNWVADKSGWFVETNAAEVIPDRNIGINLKTTSFPLAPAGQPQSGKTLAFKLFIGPKDKPLFDRNSLYKNLGFVHTMDFMACCCPAAMINPLAFGILALMKWLYGFIPNYGIVIIILVLLVRLILHPLTRKSQVSMSDYAKFNSLPEVQEIRKKYAKNIMEMNRHISEVQKKHGVSHSAAIMGMLPTLVQMPIWIALYGAIYASIDLRGARFLPFWITDLSAPDALFRFPGGFTLPFLGDSFNLLPVLMGVAFYLQQKLMPSQATAPTPEAAQQQKMMMIMMPLMFPFMLYTSPSGLNLYIMASVFGGVIEQYVIKKHIKQKEQTKEQGLVAVTSKTGGKVKKPKPKPFFKI